MLRQLGGSHWEVRLLIGAHFFFTHFPVKMMFKIGEKMKFLKKQTDERPRDEIIIAEFIVEEYRFMKFYVSAVNKLFPEEQKKYISAYRFHVDKISEIAQRAKLRIQSFEGTDYDEGLPVVPLNADEFEKSDILMIQQTIEPAIIGANGNAIKQGSVILTKKPEKKEDPPSGEETQPEKPKTIDTDKQSHIGIDKESHQEEKNNVHRN